MEVSLKSRRLRLTLAGLLGNVVEWYDFSVFAAVSDVLATKFFAASQDSMETKRIFTFVIFGIGFFVRPFGAVLFGYLGDTRGRRYSLIASVLMMSIATAITGFLPTQGNGPWQIESGAFALLAVLRIVQGLSVGGELIGTVVYTTETAPTAKWGMYGALPFATICCGVVLGLAIEATLRKTMGHDAFYDYGWRICFWIGGVFGLVTLWARKWMDETSLFNETVKLKNPVKEALTTHKKILGVVAIASGSLSTTFYLFFIWMQMLLSVHLGLPDLDASLVVSVNLLVCALLLPAFGSLSDRHGRMKIILMGGVGEILLSIPLFALIVFVGVGTAKSVVAGLCVAMMAVLFSAWGGPMPAWFVEGVPAEVRYSAIAIGYNLGVAVAGGISLVVAELLYLEYPLAPAIYLTGITLIATIFMYMYDQPSTTHKHKHKLKQPRNPYSNKLKPQTEMTDPYLDNISIKQSDMDSLMQPSELQSDYQLYDGF